MAAGTTFGWDVGGAHLKAALVRDGRVVDAFQWPCALWRGMAELDAALDAAHARWPAARQADAQHAVTMSGELVDGFAHREEGVARIGERVAERLAAPRFFAADAGWLAAPALARHWHQVASANWLATAQWSARALAPRRGLLVDIGSTTTDLVPFGRGVVSALGRTDFERLAADELVYQGVTRTPLCALARRLAWGGDGSRASVGVMNEFFATTADVYRLTGELDAAHDVHPSADGQPKDVAHTQARLARMIGLDARDASDEQWFAAAAAWRAAQLALLRDACARVRRTQGLDGVDDGVFVATGCGSFLARELAPAGWRVLDWSRSVAGVAGDGGAASSLADWADVCAPAVAVALLAEEASGQARA